MKLALTLLTFAALVGAQAPPEQSGGFKTRSPAEPPAAATSPIASPFQVAPGTHILLSMVNSVSTKQAQVGDRIYLETAFPVIVNGVIVVPKGSWVTGTVTEVKAPHRMRSKGEMQVRFDSLTLANGVTRNFHADLGALDAGDDDKLDREHSKVTSPSHKGEDAKTVGVAGASGAGLGTVIGSTASHAGQGALIGAGTGAAIGLLGVMLSRGPDAVLPRGSTVEMVLDRPLNFNEEDLAGVSASRHGSTKLVVTE